MIKQKKVKINKIIFEDIPHSAYAIYDCKPTMFLNENCSPQLYINELPPKHTISKQINCRVIDFHKVRANVLEKMKSEIKIFSELMIQGGMDTVIVSLYPMIGIYDNKDDYTVAIMDFCIVAYDHEIEI